jgi:hypothetical protein
MAWIESHQSLGTHPKLDRLCEILDIEDINAVGILHYLWWWSIDYAVDGNISKYTPGQIAKAAHWKGDRKVFLPALVAAGFVDEGEDGHHIHDWFDFCGTLVEKRLDRSENSRNAARSKWDKHRKQREKSTLGTESIPETSHTSPVRMPTNQPTVPTVPTLRAPAPANDTPTKGLNRPSTPFRHKGVVGQELKKIDGKKNGYHPPENPVRKFLLVLKQLQGYDVKDPEWDNTYLDQYNDDAVKFLKFFKMDWRTAGTCAVDIVKEFKEKDLSWSLRTIINRAPFWRKQHDKETANV